MTEETKNEQAPETQMLINFVPGEECRVAIVEDGKLEEYHVERFASASRVGNIYVGKVMNVEPAIQAAFVDFGVGDNGFLHMSDLHPRYFPGEEADTTERVGFKTPRRERPPIQACLRRGDEVIVQVLKEGVGTKGPTVTSYLSIPGRFLVMMPYMDRTGVSRKVEDEDQRRKMREILDQLELPDGFGFIVRTAGLECNKLELKRDLSYLQRLWKDMERRLKIGDKPRLLYSESDLLVRSLRDLLTADIKEVIIDHDIALNRAARFMKIVSPRGQARLLQHKSNTPIFHAFGIEQQVSLIHAREVPLPSGGRLVIDQTEAIVAIDVNSGKSRDSRNSEENAFQTNLEAVDEICRQLRLRDMGGIVINDLIDMRHASHRKEIESRFAERLKRDRARSTVLPISDFGILELTRQRMRPSHESVHFSDCPMCRGRGMVQKSDSIASDALRDLAMVLDVEKITKVEMAVSPRVAGEFLSTKRHLLSRIERVTGKHVDMRVTEQVPVDRVVFYAYDANGADVDLTSLPRPKKPKDLVEFDLGNASDAIADEEVPSTTEDVVVDESVDDPAEIHPIEQDGPIEVSDGWGPPSDGDGRRGRGRGRGGRGRSGGRDGDRAPAGAQSRGGRGGSGGGQGGNQGGRGQGRGAPIQTGGATSGRQDGNRDGNRGSTPPVHVEAKPVVRPVSRPPVAGAGAPALFAGDHGEDEGDAPTAPIEPNTGDFGGDQGLPHDDLSGAAQGAGGPEGDGAPGEGGGRRRRRRRGRGRGRGRGDGRGDGPMPAGQPGDAMQGDQNGPVGADQAHAPNVDRPLVVGDVAANGAVAGNQNFAGSHDEGADEGADGPDDGHDMNDGNGAPTGAPGSQQQQDGQGGPGEGGGRRRRRRRGRGGRGGGGGEQGHPQGHNQQGQQGQPRQQQGGQRPPDGRGGPGNQGGQRGGPPHGGHGGHDQRGQNSGGQNQGGQNQGGQSQGGQGGRDRSSGYSNSRYPRPQPQGGGSAPNASSATAPSSAPAQPASAPPSTPSGSNGAAPGGGASKGSEGGAPKPRLLYSAGRRKLNPSELNRRPKPE